MTSSSRTRSLDEDRRLALLRDLQSIQGDADQQDPTASFLPLPVHDLALRPEILVVRGERGAGKSALFRFVEELGRSRPEELRRLFEGARLPESTWVEGFSERPDHPQVVAVDAFLAGADAPAIRGFWYAHLVGRLSSRLADDSFGPPPASLEPWRKSRNAVSSWASAAADQVVQFADWLDRLDKWLGDSGQTWFVTYDYLDRLARGATKSRDAAITSLLALWTSFANRYRNLRGKVFLRQDLFDAAIRSFPDASKLAGRSISLEWSVESLYRVLIRVMAAQSGGLAEWVQDGMNRVPLERDRLLGLLPPALREKGRPSIKAFVDHLAGERVGSGSRKAYTYRWIPARLQDGHQRIVPRSIINLVAIAAQNALHGRPKGTHMRLLHHRELEAALFDTSTQRVAELAEEFPTVTCLGALKGAQLPMDRKEVERRLSDHLEQEGIRGSGSGADVVDELLRVGVVTLRSDGRVDVPDLYRYGFGMKRKGGAGRTA